MKRTGRTPGAGKRRRRLEVVRLRRLSTVLAGRSTAAPVACRTCRTESVLVRPAIRTALAELQLTSLPPGWPPPPAPLHPPPFLPSPRLQPSACPPPPPHPATSVPYPAHLLSPTSPLQPSTPPGAPSSPPQQARHTTPSHTASSATDNSPCVPPHPPASHTHSSTSAQPVSSTLPLEE